jgi:hypothetical protein
MADENLLDKIVELSTREECRPGDLIVVTPEIVSCSRSAVHVPFIPKQMYIGTFVNYSAEGDMRMDNVVNLAKKEEGGINMTYLTTIVAKHIARRITEEGKNYLRNQNEEMKRHLHL